jgi:carbon storage regulator
MKGAIMLILNRKEGQSVIITTDAGEEIEISVLEIKGKYAKLGFTAPVSVGVDRKEVSERKKGEDKDEK